MSKLKTLPEPLASLRGHLNDCTRDLFEERIRVTDVWVDPPDVRFGLSRNGTPFTTIQVFWPLSLQTTYSPAGEALARSAMDQIVEFVLKSEGRGASGSSRPARREDEEELRGRPNLR